MGSLGVTVPTAKTTPSGIREIAVALALATESDFHLGCYYRDPDTDSVYLLHFPIQGKIRRVEPRDAYVWATPALSYIELRSVKSVCAAIYERYKQAEEKGESGPNFALRYLTRFADDMSLTLVGPSAGFTCATFVMAIFERAKIKLLQTETWPSRPDDKARQERMHADYVAGNLAPPDVLDQIKKDIGSIRFRPEEVMAAATFKRVPVPFKKAKPKGEAIAKLLKKLDKRLG